MKTCLGCSLTQGELPIYEVYESENVMAILDHEPFNDGHLLILPKYHRQEFTELTAKELIEIQQTIYILSNVLNKLVVPDGITILQNGGIFNELTHFHFHIVPRYDDNNFAEFFSTTKDGYVPDVVRLQIMQKNIIEAINLLG